jgi:hypothetical protein
MPDFRSMYDSNYLYAFDLKGRDVTVTIKEVRAAKVMGTDGKSQKKPLVFFKESHDNRGLVLCKTNGKTIAAMYGNDTAGWVGNRVTLFPTTTEAFKQTVDCIRIRPQVPNKGKPTGEFAEAPEAPAPEAPEHAEVDEREPGLELT